MEKNDLTLEQAKALYDSGFWSSMSERERAEFQIATPRLCMPFAVFQEAVEKTLGRPVWTHEFAYPERLRAELYGKRKAPTFQEILALIPAHVRTIVV